MLWPRCDVAFFVFSNNFQVFSHFPFGIVFQIKSKRHLKWEGGGTGGDDRTAQMLMHSISNIFRDSCRLHMCKELRLIVSIAFSIQVESVAKHVAVNSANNTIFHVLVVLAMPAVD